RGCTSTAAITITQPTAITLTLSKTDVTTTGGTDGTATVVATGGTPGYTYLWSNGATTSTATGLVAAAYTVTVTDANGCTRTGSITVGSPQSGVCGSFRTYGLGGWGSSSTSIPGAYLNANFSSVFPNGLVIGACGSFIRLTSSTAVRAFLPTSGTPKKLNLGTLLNPTSASYSNTLAGQLVALRLNIAFDSANAAFAPSGILFKNAVVTSGQFAGFTVQQLYDAANTAIGCGGTKSYLSALTDALNLANESWRDGIQRNTYIACPGTVVARVIADQGTELSRPVAYPNPTAGRVMIKYDMIESGRVSIEIYNLNGQRVIFREIEHDGMGEYNFELQLTEAGLTNGLYLVRMIRNGVADDMRIVLTN
ncbi:MAG: hypothetical protein RIQ47_975, partial [Bacteroidota bacterium]